MMNGNGNDSCGSDGGVAVTRFMNSLLKEYAKIRGKRKASYPKAFWDILVITTVDQAQQEAYQLQIEEKLRRQELPIDLPVHVISDPPGARIGNGGSTLVALEELDKLYGSDLFTKKVLLIHAGGWSQRMPSASVLGKVFSLLPHGNPPYQMLDLKLALFWPLVERMQPGVFLTCADDFVLYSLPDQSDWEIPGHGFTCLAHPAPIALGRTHGVYVLPDTEEMDTSKELVVSPCLKVLQKNNDERMEAQGAVLKGEDHHFADGKHIQGKAVYVDSCFLFGTDVMRKLITFKKNAGDLSCEIDAYGDFLQAVGKNATNDYISSTGNVRQKSGRLLKMRQAVFDCLNGTDINILVLNASSFIHIGTTREMLYHFCENEGFQKKMAFENEVFNMWTVSPPQKVKITQRNDSKVSTKACIMHSAFHADSVVAADCAIDCCGFEVPVKISKKCILSNCQLRTSEMTLDATAGIEVPQGVFLHTVPVQGNKCTKFITVFFHIEDDLKKALPLEQVEDLPFWGSSVGVFLKSQGLSLEDVLPHNGKPVPTTVSLWDLKLYPARLTMTASLEDALEALSSKKTQISSKDTVLFSLADILVHKDVRAMLTFRTQLYEKIKKSK